MMPLWTTRDFVGGMRMGIVFGGRAMRRPARMADADVPGNGSACNLRGKFVKLAFGAAVLDLRRSPAWRCRRCHSRDIRVSSARPPERAQPDVPQNTYDTAHFRLVLIFNVALQNFARSYAGVKKM